MNSVATSLNARITPTVSFLMFKPLQYTSVVLYCINAVAVRFNLRFVALIFRTSTKDSMKPA